MIRALLFLVFVAVNVEAQTPSNAEIEAYWTEASRQVAEGDYEAYAASFHKEAILVNGIGGQGIPIQVALDGWKQGFDDTKAGKMTASVDFRFSDQVIGETTAHQTGIFRYAWQNQGEEPQVVYIHYEALLTKSTGVWTILMEYQKSMATLEEWETLE